MARGARKHEEPSPDKRVVTPRQSEYLAQLSGLPQEELAGKPIRELDQILRWRIDPEFLFFRRVCGRVVRVDPGTGDIEGVPNATVYVEDTDCSFLGFFPVDGPWDWWWWLWPIFCDREVIATTITDECGRFCVWIPRWDIDRILSFRRERICFPEIFKPSLGDILKEVGAEQRPPIRVDPNPPDPAPFEVPERAVLDQAGALLGRPSLGRLAASAGQEFGGQTGDLRTLLEEPAFLDAFPPPLRDDALERLEQVEGLPGSGERDQQRGVSATSNLDLSVSRAVGPFLRCRDIIVPEWQVVLDLPDITFRVTQDVDLDGDEETIYSESFFDVRWDVGDIAPVTLVASPIARPSPICEGPSIPCGDTPEIVTVGLMPLASTHHTNATGTATRVNRPRPGGLYSDPQVSPGQAPYAGTLQLHGCHDIGGAQWYRVLYAYNGASEVPFTGLEWFPPTLTGPPWWMHAFPDAAGWYKMPTAAEFANLVFPNWILNWPTTSFSDGEYVVRLQLADASKNPLSPPEEFSPPVTFAIDNKAPTVNFSQIRWRVSGGAWLPQNTFTWPFVCIVIERPTGADIEIEVTWGATATHLRDVSISASGCGAGTPGLLSAVSTSQHWHENFGDNSVSNITLYTLPGSAAQGSYGFSIDAWSRAFNPAGDGGGPATNWLANYSYIEANPSVDVAVIDH